MALDWARSLAVWKCPGGMETATLADSKLRVLLVGNYRIDRLQSMDRFAEIMASELMRRGHEVRVIRPEPFFGNVALLGRTAAKWLGYIDKFVLFPRNLKQAARWADIVHICDHSNAMYVPAVKRVPHLITCHDLLAVRAGLGEVTHVQVSPTGRILQRLILAGLGKSEMVVCDSTATRSDAEKLLLRDGEADGKDLRLILLGLNYPYRILPLDTARARLSVIDGLDVEHRFLLHVGSSHPRKNRSSVLKIFGMIAGTFSGQCLFAGQMLPPDLMDFAAQLGITERIVQVAGPSNELLEAIYNSAYALVYPSLSEGFGWPIIEAQACGCPVVCSNAGSCAEVAGEGAFVFEPNDIDGFASALLELNNDAERQRLVDLGLKNSRRFSTEAMVEKYEEVYYYCVSHFGRAANCAVRK